MRRLRAGRFPLPILEDAVKGFLHRFFERVDQFGAYAVDLNLERRDPLLLHIMTEQVQFLGHDLVEILQLAAVFFQPLPERHRHLYGGLTVERLLHLQDGVLASQRLAE